MKPYFVTLQISAVVMADSAVKAMVEAEFLATEIARDGEISAEESIEIESLDCLLGFDPEWTGDCIPYNGDDTTRLKEILPQMRPFKDTKTIDIFA